MDIDIGQRNTIRDIQIKSIYSFLNLEFGTHTTREMDHLSGKRPVWKVLILDSFTKKILLTILKVSDLREHNVTLYLQIENKRMRIPDVPAIYFIRPTLDNILRIEKDFQEQLYSRYYFDFSSYVDSDILDELAKISIRYNQTSNVMRVMDQYLNFICLEKDLITMEYKNSFLLINHPKTTESDVESLTGETMYFLLSILTKLNSTPLIRYEKNPLLEKLAHVLEKQLKDHYTKKMASGLQNKNQGNFGQNDLLLLLDRNIDIVTPLKHKWTYGSLIYDFLDVHLNKIDLFIEENGEKIKRVYDIDIKDTFWVANTDKPFPEAAENADKELHAYKEEMSKISISEDSEGMGGGSEALLKSALGVMPSLTEKKRIVDIHMNIALAVLNEAQNRNLDCFFTFEQNMGKQTKKSFFEIFKNDQMGTCEDKIRLFAIFYILMDLTAAEVGDCKNTILEHYNVLLDPIVEFLKMFKLELQVLSGSNTPTTHVSSCKNPMDAQPKDNKFFLGGFSNIGSKISEKIKDGSISGMLNNMMNGVMNLIPDTKNIPIIRKVDQLMGMSVKNQSNELNYEIKTENTIQRVPKYTKGFYQQTHGTKHYNRVVIFVIGGLSYDEYQLIKTHFGKHYIGTSVVISSTEIISPRSLIEQMGNLGDKQLQ